ncbi:MAG: ABC transporter ATP-binding protein [Chloroflexota bacterium]
MTMAIDIQELERIYNPGAQQVVALKKVNLQVPQGKFLAIKGRSGSGKTTLLNCVGGLDQPTSGSIKIFDRELANLSSSQLTQWRRKNVGYIFQSFGLLPTLSAYENVELMLRIARVPRRQRKGRAYEVLNMVGLEKWATHRPYEMSGGQQQRLAIARAISTKPQLILADEATGELDSETARIILQLFQDIVKAENMTLLVVTHDDLVDEYADEVVVLHDGAILNKSRVE